MTDRSLAKGYPMAGGNGQTQYLRNAIAKVQRQKQRPTASRIYKAVRQCIDGITLEQVTGWLELAVRLGELIVVDNDGVFSYREPRHNISNLTQPVQHSSASVTSLDTHNFSESLWRLQCDPYCEFMPQHASSVSGWHITGMQQSAECMMPFGYERIPESYTMWHKPVVAADNARTLHSEPANRQNFGNSMLEPNYYEPSNKYMRVDCSTHPNDFMNCKTDANLIKHVNNESEVARMEFAVDTRWERTHHNVHRPLDCPSVSVMPYVTDTKTSFYCHPTDTLNSSSTTDVVISPNSFNNFSAGHGQKQNDTSVCETSVFNENENCQMHCGNSSTKSLQGSGNGEFEITNNQPTNYGASVDTFSNDQMHEIKNNSYVNVCHSLAGSDSQEHLQSVSEAIELVTNFSEYSKVNGLSALQESAESTCKDEQIMLHLESQSADGEKPFKIPAVSNDDVTANTCNNVKTNENISACLEQPGSFIVPDDNLISAQSAIDEISNSLLTEVKEETSDKVSQVVDP